MRFVYGLIFILILVKNMIAEKKPAVWPAVMPHSATRGTLTRNYGP